MAESRRAIFERSMARENAHDFRPRGLGEFGFQGPLRGEFVDGDRFFRLTEPLIYQSRHAWPTRAGGAMQLFVVEAGSVCDLESIPKWLMAFTASAKSGTLHDESFKVGWLSFRNSNGLYREALDTQHVPGWRRDLRWLGVSAGSYPYWRRYRAGEKSFLADGGSDF